MDTSFDVFGGAGGWGADQGDNDFQASQAAHRTSSFEKLLVPVSIKDLLSNTEQSDGIDQETFKIGNYCFKTIRVIGKVANCSTDGNNVTIYELVPYNGDIKTSKRFTLIRHLGNDNVPQSEEPAYELSTLVHATGLLRFYNNRLSLLTYHIRESSEEEAELFNYDVRFANYYYSENMPDSSVFQMEKYANTILATGLINKGQAGSTAQNRGENTQINRLVHGSNPAASLQHNQKMESFAASQQMSGLSQQQQRIFQYIITNAAAETGVSLDAIKRSLKLSDISEDISQLLGDGRIYSTIDDDHYAPVNQ